MMSMKFFVGNGKPISEARIPQTVLDEILALTGGYIPDSVEQFRKLIRDNNLEHSEIAEMSLGRIYKVLSDLETAVEKKDYEKYLILKKEAENLGLGDVISEKKDIFYL